MTVQTETFASAQTLGVKLTDLRARLSETFAKRKIYNTTFRELDRLTDRELADLGIARSLIRQIAYDAAYGK